MNPLEISILTGVFLLLVAVKIIPARKIELTFFFSGTNLILVLIICLLNGVYFQLIPAVILIIWLILRGIHLLKRPHETLLKTWVGKITFAFIFIFSLLLHVLFPLSKLPEPDGVFPVGVGSFIVSDKHRSEVITKDTADFRKFIVKVWYPARLTGKEKKASYLNNAGDILASGIAGQTGKQKPSKFVHLFFSYLENIKTHSYKEATLAMDKNKFPVLIFNHGLFGFAEQNTLQMEHLASNGYIVFSINHTYDALAVYFSENEIIPAKDFRSETTNSTNAFQLITDLMEEVEPVAFEKNLLEYFKTYPNSIDLMKYWNEDMNSLLQYLEQIDKSHMLHKFHNKLDLKNIGVFGMSMGGGAAVEFSLNNKQCKACVSLDGIYFADSLNNKMDIPFMVMERDFQYSYHLKQNKYGFNDFLIKRSTQPTYKLQVKNSAHFNFTDANYLFPAFRFVGTYMLGNANRQEVNDMMNMYLLSFFNKHLKNDPDKTVNTIIYEGD